MTQRLPRLGDIAADYDAIVFDQWGVLHNGDAPYPGAPDVVHSLSQQLPLAVLSNSGKRSAPNAQRIAHLGFPTNWFADVMTSGEAMYREIAGADIPHRRFFPIESAPGDAKPWAAGLDIDLVDDVANADALLMMGLPDYADLAAWEIVLEVALANNLPAYCSNPDKHSPRGDDTVVSIGALAFQYQDAGAEVRFYGKPHRPIFTALQSALNAERILMIGDSLEHDVAGAAEAGWDSLFLTGGLYHARFKDADWATPLAQLRTETKTPAPTYIMETLACPTPDQTC